MQTKTKSANIDLSTAAKQCFTGSPTFAPVAPPTFAPIPLPTLSPTPVPSAAPTRFVNIFEPGARPLKQTSHFDLKPDYDRINTLAKASGPSCSSSRSAIASIHFLDTNGDQGQGWWEFQW